MSLILVLWVAVVFVLACRMRVIGITGGIACGKSTVDEFLLSAGAVIIDADQIAHKIYETNPGMVRKIDKEFPGTV